MALTVFAEKMGFFHKGSAGIGVAPLDVCLTPPGVPVPYTNVLFAKDLIKGSKTVRIAGEPTFLEDYSETSTSIGDEPGSLGSVVTGVHLGKGYFMVWSMTVYIEGLGVCRHGDMMGQNSASAPPSSIDAAAISQPANVTAPTPGPVASKRAAEAKVYEATGPGDSKPPVVLPCDFAKIVLKCKHCGKDRMASFNYTYPGKIVDNLPRPKAGSKRVFSSNVQLVAGEDTRRADKLSVELSGGPGYTCSKSHPRITLTDRETGEKQKHQGELKADFDLTCKKIELPAVAYMSPAAVLAYFFFSPKTTRRYMLEVESCGVLEDKSPGFRKLSRNVEVFSSDVYKLTLSIPTIAKRSYQNGATRKLEPNAQFVKGEGDDKPGWNKGMMDGSDWVGKVDPATGKAPVDIPIEKAGESITLTRNSEDLNATAKLGEIIQSFVNIQNRIQSVMNFIKDFQPQVGWKFGFSIGFFTGDLAFEWAAKEAKDHAVFRWWKFEAALSLVKIELEASFGVDFKVWWARFTVLFFGKVEGEAKLNASCEATPDEPEWSTALNLEIKGELGIKGALGADWVAAEGKLGLGFPFEAKPKITAKEGLKIDWKLEFSGLKADLTGSIRFVGSFSRSWDIMDKQTLGEGTFPDGTKQATGVKTQ